MGITMLEICVLMLFFQKSATLWTDTSPLTEQKQFMIAD